MESKTSSLSVEFGEFREIENPGFIRATCRVAYAGENRNYTDIPKDAFDEAEPTIFGTPVVGNWLGDNFGGHDFLLEIRGNDIVFKDTTIAYGFVPQDANPRWEQVEDENGNSKNYYTVDVVLWEERFPEEIEFIKKNGANHSMEIMTTDVEYLEDSHYMRINNFYYFGLCILGRDIDEDGNKGSGNVEPCFEDSQIAIGSFALTDRLERDIFAMKSVFEGGENLDKDIGLNAEEFVDEEINEELDELEAEDEFKEEDSAEENDIEELEEIEEEGFDEEVEVVDEEEGEPEIDYEEKYIKLFDEYNTLKSEYDNLLEINKDLQAYKDAKESEMLAEQKDNIISDYSLILDKATIDEITANRDKFSVDELEVKLSKAFATKKLEEARIKSQKESDTVVFDGRGKNNTVKKNKFAL